MWALDYKECLVPMNWCFWTVMLEKTLESPLDFKEILPIHPKGNQSWIFIGRTDAEAETLILCHQMWRTDSFEKTLMLGRFSGRRRKGGQRMRWLDGIINSMNIIKLNEFEQTPGVGDRQGSLECYSSWGHKELNMTEQLNWTEEYTVALFWQVNGSSYNLW